MNTGIIIAILVVIVVTRIASWVSKQQRIAAGQLPKARGDDEGNSALDALQALDRSLGQLSPGPTPRQGRPAGGVVFAQPVQRTGPVVPDRQPLSSRRSPVTTAMRPPPGAARTGPLGEPMGPRAFSGTEVATMPIPAGLPPVRVPGAVPARVPPATPARRPAGPAKPGAKAAAAKVAAAVAQAKASPKDFEVQSLKVQGPKAADRGAPGRRLAKALLQSSDGRQAALLLHAIFGEPPGLR